MKETVYITTTLPYVNAEPHIGFAMEIIQADVLARYYQQIGREVFLNTGTDEHGLKIYQKAEELGRTSREHVDELAKKFFALKELLNIDWDNFIRTTDERHIHAAQEFWKKCDANGDIYKKKYCVKYCVGCEMEKTDSELVDGKCPIHPNAELEIIEEENYFFRYSNYEKRLLDLYEKKEGFVVPNHRLNEIRSFVSSGLNDFSISRLRSKLPWGVPVPGDDEQVMYVWFDALVNYISAIGWPEDMEKFNKWWPVIQLAGKDNLRPQAAMWQAMLMSAGMEPSEKIFINGFINVDGQKMSKSLGNVISPMEMVEKFGVDGARYLLLTAGVFGQDADVSWDKFATKFNADLANGIGNLASRIIKLYGKTKKSIDLGSSLFKNEQENMEGLRFDLELERIMELARSLDKKMEEKRPWELAKADFGLFEEVILELTSGLSELAKLIAPFMPETGEKIVDGIKEKEIKGLFPRLN